jgi:hypothetical protein
MLAAQARLMPAIAIAGALVVLLLLFALVRVVFRLVDR